MGSTSILLSIGSVVASMIAVFGSLYYCFVESTPGAGIPGPYRAVPVVLAVGVVSGAAIAGALRRSRPETFAGMGAIFE